MRYLRTRKRDNSISKFVQVPVPSDLKEAYGGKRYVEKYLRGEGEILKNQVHQEVALIFSEFEAKRGRDKSVTIAEEKARREATRSTFEWLLANASTGPADLAMVLPAYEFEGGQPDKRIREVLNRIGETLPESQFERIGNAITDGDFDALALFKKGLQPSLSSPKNSRTLDEVANAYFEYVAHDENASWTAQTTAQYESTVRLLSNHVGGGKGIATISTDVATSFLDRIARLHPHWGRYGNTKDLSLDELLAKYPGKLTNKTINRHHIALRGLFDWAIERKWYPSEERNPFAFKLRKKGDRTKKPFTVDMLNALLEFPDPKPAEHTWTTTRPWVSLAALYSGMREDEIGSLTVADIIEVDGVKFFNIADSKSPAGVRRVPLHSVLLNYGFMEYVKHLGQGTLWPGIEPGGKSKSRGYTIAKKYPAWRRTVGAQTIGGPDDYDFHSYRRSAVSEFVRQRVHLSEYAELIGHERSFTNKHYAPLGLTPDHAQLLIEKLEYPGIKLPQNP